MSPEYNNTQIYGTFNMVEESNFFGAKMLEVEDDIVATEKVLARIVSQQQKAIEKGNHDQFVLFKKMEHNKKTRLEILKNEKYMPIFNFINISFNQFI